MGLLRGSWQRWLIFAMVYGLTAFMLMFALVPHVVNIELGQVSPRLIVASRVVEDTYTTSLLQGQAELGVAEVYEQDPLALERVMGEARSILTFVLETVQTHTDVARQGEIVRARLTFALSDAALATVLEIDTTVAEQLLAELEQVLGPVYRLGIKADGLDMARSSVAAAIQATTLRQPYRVLLTEMARGIMVPNMRFNAAATERMRAEARQAVRPVMLQVGEKVIGQGEIATEREITLLHDLGLLERAFDWRTVLGSLLLAFLALAVPALYLYRYQLRNGRAYGEIGLIAVVYIGALVIGLGLNRFSGFLFPIAGAGILLTVLLNAKVGLLVGGALSLLSVGLVGYDVRYLVVAVIGTAVGVLAASSKAHSQGIARAGMAVGVANALTITALGLLFGDFSPALLIEVAWGLASGVVAAVLALGFLPFLEQSFGMTSHVRLMELQNPNHPLLKRLLIEAPGTYHHSAVVANLAEAAALEVGANHLLARTGAYYHDVGKMLRPYFFIENQIMIDNPHERYVPQVSARVIINHVQDGVQLAREHKLPPFVIDIIREHHGTSLVQYFFAKAQEQDPEAKPEDYCYDGPRPTSKESAIVMLADVVEAAVRASQLPTPVAMAQKVHALIRERLYQGQLDHSALTMRDLEKVTAAFVRLLASSYHHRIDYPEGGLKIAGTMDGRTGQVTIAGTPAGVNGATSTKNGSET